MHNRDGILKLTVPIHSRGNCASVQNIWIYFQNWVNFYRENAGLNRPKRQTFKKNETLLCLEVFS